VSEPLRALIVDDDRNSVRALADLVGREGYRTATAETLREARAALEEEPVEVVLCDLVLPDGQGIDLLKELGEDSPTEMILITANASIETAVEALRLGAYDYLTKPLDFSRLKHLLSRLQETRALSAEVADLRHQLRELGRFGSLVGTSPPMQEVYDLIERVAPTDATVLVVGGSGTGKELVGETLHRLSRRHEAPYLKLNCGAVQPNLIESELFGHEKGSFTGAERQHRGYFERARGGTLLLDEITEMPIELQVKLLRVLETNRIVRLGGDREIQVDVRILAATNRDPEDAVEEGKLREDLFYRLKVFPIRLPDLLARGRDIPLLAQSFLDRLNKSQETDKRFTDATLKRFAAYSWPGNVRELENTVERAFILADEDIDVDCLPPEVRGEEPARGPVVRVKVGSSVAEAEKRLILATLNELGGDKKKAAEMLGVSLKTLYNRLHQYEDERNAGASPEPQSN